MIITLIFSCINIDNLSHLMVKRVKHTNNQYITSVTYHLSNKVC